MVFKENVIQNLTSMWVNINEEYHYNEWHIHPGAILSGAYYIKHDGSSENGDVKDVVGLTDALLHADYRKATWIAIFLAFSNVLTGINVVNVYALTIF